MGYRIPQQGECYRHFKGNRYQVLAIAKHTETQEDLVIYQGLYGDHPVFARPLEMFAGKIDKEMFPNVTQEYRFELEEDTAVTDRSEHQMIMQFLEIEDKEKQIIFLQRVRDELTDSFLTSVAQSLDFAETGKTLEERYQDLIHCIETRIKYEGTRV